VESIKPGVEDEDEDDDEDEELFFPLSGLKDSIQSPTLALLPRQLAFGDLL
jgi:hypothetical protein